MEVVGTPVTIPEHDLGFCRYKEQLERLGFRFGTGRRWMIGTHYLAPTTEEVYQSYRLVSFRRHLIEFPDGCGSGTRLFPTDLTDACFGKSDVSQVTCVFCHLRVNRPCCLSHLTALHYERSVTCPWFGRGGARAELRRPQTS